MIKKLSFKFSPDKFSNPSLQRYYQLIESIALGLKEDETPAFIDQTGNGVKKFVHNIRCKI
jgi:hypothetical protein